MTPQNILVLGGAGMVGRAVCERLVRRASSMPTPAQSPRILVPTRRRRHASAVQPLPHVEVIETDVHDDAQLLRLVGQAHAVINLVAQLHGSEAVLARPNVGLPTRLAQACHQAGVRRVIHVSALGVDQPSSRYLRSKAAGETALLEPHQRGALDLSVLRPSVIFGAQDKFTNLFAAMQAVMPCVPLACAQAQFQPVWVDDVAEAIVRLLDGAVPRQDAVVECAGPEVMTLASIVQLCGRIAGHQRPVLALPAPIARLQALCLEAMPGEPLMSRDNLDSMQQPNVATGHHPGLASLGIASASMAQVLPTYLQAPAGPARLDAWRARAGRL